MNRTKVQDWTFTLLRVVTALMYMQHGVQKLFGWLGGRQVDTLVSQFGLAGVLEAFGGLLILLGLFTRPVAFLLSGEMAVAYFQMHAPNAFWPIANRGELPALYCFIYLFFAAWGAGPYSLDAWLRRRRGLGTPPSA